MDKKIKVGYQGAHGTFSEIAVQEFFKDRPFTACNYANFPSIIADVESGAIDYALLPVENTTTGIIYRTYDLLKDSDIFAVGEILEADRRAADRSAGNEHRGSARGVFPSGTA